MKAEDLLRAFQSVETDITDAAEYNTSESDGKADAAPMIVHTETGRQRQVYAAAGIAAAVVICCIGYLGIAAMRNENMQAASQPAETSVTGTDITEEAEAAYTEAVTQETGETDTEPTDCLQTLPPEDFVEITPDMQEDTEEVPLLNRSRSHGANIEFIGSHTPGATAELSEADTPEQFQLSLSCWVEDYEGPAYARVVLMQDGEVIPYALTKNGRPEEWRDFTLDIQQSDSMEEFPGITPEIWLTPKHESEYSLLYSLVSFYSPDDILIGAQAAATPLHCANVQTSEGDVPYAAASDADYVDFPAALLNSQYAFSGVGLGKYLDYNANIPGRYSIDNLNRYDLTFRRDELYIRLHMTDQERSITDDVYLTVLCDGKPCRVFDGKNSLRIETPPEDKTLCYPLTLDEETVPDGIHSMTAFALGSTRGQIRSNPPYSHSNYGLTPPVIVIQTQDSAEADVAE